MESEPHLSNRDKEYARQRIVMLQDTIKVVEALREAILNDPNNMV